MSFCYLQETTPVDKSLKVYSFAVSNLHKFGGFMMVVALIFMISKIVKSNGKTENSKSSTESSETKPAKKTFFVKFAGFFQQISTFVFDYFIK